MQAHVIIDFFPHSCTNNRSTRINRMRGLRIDASLFCGGRVPKKQEEKFPSKSLRKVVKMYSVGQRRRENMKPLIFIGTRD